MKAYKQYKNKNDDKSEIDYKVSGQDVGGMVGSAFGTVTIKNSFAATKVDIAKSYADCYLKGGSYVGGLVGFGAAKLANCYAAGFIVDPTDSAATARLVNGTVTDTSNVYSVVRMMKTETEGGTTTLDRPQNHCIMMGLSRKAPMCATCPRRRT